jgi:hypothetical protein
VKLGRSRGILPGGGEKIMKRLVRGLGWVLVGIVGTLTLLLVRNAALSHNVPVRPGLGPLVSTNMWKDGMIWARGTWIMENDRPAFPLQMTEIYCVRSHGTCTTATAEVQDDALNVEMETLQIDRWSDDAVVVSNSSAVCADYIYTISRANQRMVGTRSPKKRSDDRCSLASANTIQMTLGNGFDVALRMEREAASKVDPFLWTALVVLWLFVASRFVRRRRSTPVVTGEPA